MAQINKPTDNFNIVEWTGDATASRNITGVGFQPDWTWIKCRDENYNNNVFDVVRGANKYIYTDSDAAEVTATNRLNSWNADGFNIGDATNVNKGSPARNYVAWNWKAGNSQGTSNTDGSINTTYTSVNATAGFSISSYTGTASNATVGHGLNAVPKMIWFKELNPSTTRSWRVYHQALGNANVMYLDTTNASTSDATAFNSTTPTNQVFSLGTSAGVNGSGKNYVAYCFAEKNGYSKFSSYTGNGNANGAFIYTGFKPALVIIKKTSATGSWTIWDTKREPNEFARPLYTNLNNAESTQSTVKLDLLSNGFKLRGNGSNINSSGGTYVYMAWAKEPLVGTNNAAATGR